VQSFFPITSFNASRTITLTALKAKLVHHFTLCVVQG
jgi:hypothetical protein